MEPSATFDHDTRTPWTGTARLPGRRAWQTVYVVLALIPTSTSLLALIVGSARFLDAAAVDVALDNTYRYLGGIYLAIAALVLWAVPRLEDRIDSLVFAAIAIALGAIGRVISIADVGSPGTYVWFVLVLEFGVLPLTLYLRNRVRSLERLQGV